MNQANQVRSVDFIVNTFERTYREVLAPGFVAGMANSHCYSFSKRIVIINNVADRLAAEERADDLKNSGEITEYYFVADLLENTLRKAELTLADLEPNVHYTNWALTAAFLDWSEFFVHCDADVRLKERRDWITPSLELMMQDPRIAVANPNWTSDSLTQEVREFHGDFGIGYGFSDQLYLVRRTEFARPIYQFYAPISLRYPMSAMGRIFEQMVDSYMRVNGRMRATLTTVEYIHGAEEGASHTKLKGVARLKQARNAAVLFTLKALGFKHPRYHV
jgi:hypothetical protein